MPNLATLMTGRMPSVHGVRSNGIAAAAAADTFVDVLRAAGYATALVGKTHLQNFSDIPGVLNGRPRATVDQVLDAGFAEAEKPSAVWMDLTTRNIPTVGRPDATST